LRHILAERDCEITELRSKLGHVCIAQLCILFLPFVKNDFNESTTKVIHIGDNPMSMAREHYANEMDYLRMVWGFSIFKNFIFFAGMSTPHRALCNIGGIEK
jgi:hypothetical protein